MTTSITQGLERYQPQKGFRFTAFTRWLRKKTLSQLDQLEHGRLEIHEKFEGGQSFTLGGGGPLPTPIMSIHSPAFYGALALGGPNAVTDLYLSGDWDCDEPVNLVRLMARNLGVSDAMTDSLTGRLSRLIARGFYQLFQQNNLRGSRRNIAAHYDLGNDFFELFLDPTLSYSCALYSEDATTLHNAQIAKIDRLVDKLDLDASQHLLEIGSGWGALAISAAQRTGCRVTTITLSERQLETTRQRIHQAGLSDRVEVLLTDYRDLTPPPGGFDKFVSVEMIEAVGRRYYPTYFRRISELLCPEGRGVIQAITIADQRFDKASREVDFIKRYIFPGSCIPSVEAMSRAATAASDLRLTHLEDFSPHYTRTLLDWRHNLRANHETVLSRGYPPALLRMWEFYLAYCAGGFAERNIGLVQIEWRKPGCRDHPLNPAPLRHPRRSDGRKEARSQS
jgi:cyclopropane-fatty-acyl-phospholipid synthase